MNGMTGKNDEISEEFEKNAPHRLKTKVEYFD